MYATQPYEKTSTLIFYIRYYMMHIILTTYNYLSLAYKMEVMEKLTVIKYHIYISYQLLHVMLQHCILFFALKSIIT